jgi:hypothetical protein
MRQHVVDRGYWASVWLTSHTSSDPRVGLSGDVVTGGGVLSHTALLTPFASPGCTSRVNTLLDIRHNLACSTLRACGAKNQLP